MNLNLIWIAIKNLANNRGFGLSIMTWLSVGGVAVGVTSLIIVLSVMGGFADKLLQKMLNGEPHVEVFAKNTAAGFSMKQLSPKTLQELIPDAKSIQAFTKSDVVLKHRNNLQAAELVGINPESDTSLWSFGKPGAITEGSIESVGKMHEPLITEDRSQGKWPGIILGEGLATNLGVTIGDEIFVINPMVATDVAEAIGAETSMRRYVLTGIFEAMDIKYDNKWAVVNLSEGRRFMAEYNDSLQDDEYVTALAFNLSNPFTAATAKAKLAHIEDINPVTWQESNESLLFALKLEKYAMGCILMLIVVVASFSISATMMMTVFHRRTQICLLRAIGLTKKGVTWLYLIHGCTIGVVGIIFGAVLGILGCWVIEKTQMITLPSGIYYEHLLPVKFIPSTYLVICLLSLLLCLLASIVPALTAAAQSPSNGLRYE